MERKALFGRGSSLLISSPALVLFGAGVLLALRLGSDADAEIFRALCALPLRETLAETLTESDFGRAEALLRGILPSALHPFLAELLHELD